MLITRLVEYAQNEELTKADPFFEVKPIRWLVLISPEGRFVKLLRMGDERRGLEFKVPKKVGGNAGGVATFGTDNPRFVLGHTESTDGSQKAHRDLAAFTALMTTAATANPTEPELKAAVEFYADAAQLESARSAASASKVKDGDRIALAVTTGGNVPIFDSSVGRAFWRGYRRAQEASKKEQDAVICLSCGMEKPPVLTAEKLMGVPGGQASGTSLLSFDKDSFQSLGWDKNKNAPVCGECSFGYTRGLNHLLLRSNTPRTRVDQGGVAFQFWLDSGSAGNIIDNWFEEPDSQEAEMLLSAARTGRPLGDRPDQRLFALGLRGNGGRAIVTDWFDTTLADAYRNLSRWFDDLSVVLARDETEKGVIYRNTGEISRPPRLWALCRATARADAEVSPRTPAALFRAALRGEKLPLAIAQSCIRRLPLDGFGDFFTPARVGLIRCTLNRLSSGEKILMPGLDLENHQPSYLCGRLLATLEAIQYAGVGDVGANIVDRFYGKASTAPALVFGPMLTLAQSHLGAIKNDGQRINLDRELSEVVGRLESNLPKTLNLEDQGRFAIGYYHQKAHRFAEIRHRQDERAAAITLTKAEE